MWRGTINKTLEVRDSSKLGHSYNLDLTLHHQVEVSIACVVLDTFTLSQECDLGLAKHSHLTLENCEIIDFEHLYQVVIQTILHYEWPQDQDGVLGSGQLREKTVTELKVGRVVVEVGELQV